MESLQIRSDRRIFLAAKLIIQREPPWLMAAWVAGAELLGSKFFAKSLSRVTPSASSLSKTSLPTLRCAVIRKTDVQAW